ALDEPDQLSFGGGEHVEPTAGGACARSARLHQSIERVVVAEWVVVEEGEPFGAGRHGIVDGPLGRRVTPAGLLRVFVDGVLRIVDDEVRVGKEGDMPPVFGVRLPRRTG